MPIQSLSENRVHVVYTAPNSSHYVSGGPKIVNVVNEVRPSVEKK